MRKVLLGEKYLHSYLLNKMVARGGCESFRFMKPVPCRTYRTRAETFLSYFYCVWHAELLKKVLYMKAFYHAHREIAACIKKGIFSQKINFLFRYYTLRINWCLFFAIAML